MSTDDTDHTANVDTLCGLALDKLAAAQRELAAAQDLLYDISARRAKAAVGISDTDYQDAAALLTTALRETRGAERVVTAYQRDLADAAAEDGAQ